MVRDLLPGGDRRQRGAVRVWPVVPALARAGQVQGEVGSKFVFPLIIIHILILYQMWEVPPPRVPGPGHRGDGHTVGGGRGNMWPV